MNCVSSPLPIGSEPFARPATCVCRSAPNGRGAGRRDPPPCSLGPKLRDVVADGGEDHIFAGAWIATRVGCGAAHAGGSQAFPSVESFVRVLQAELEGTARAGIEAVPQAGGAFDYVAGVRRASGQRPGSVSAAAGIRFSPAAGVVEPERAEAFVWNRPRSGDVLRATRILFAHVEVNIPLRVVERECAQTLIAADQSNGSVRPQGDVRGVLGGAIAAHAVAHESMKAEIDVAMGEW